jgi:hypothetical protein
VKHVVDIIMPNFKGKGFHALRHAAFNKKLHPFLKQCFHQVSNLDMMRSHQAVDQASAFVSHEEDSQFSMLSFGILHLPIVSTIVVQLNTWPG